MTGLELIDSASQTSISGRALVRITKQLHDDEEACGLRHDGEIQSNQTMKLRRRDLSKAERFALLLPVCLTVPAQTHSLGD